MNAKKAALRLARSEEACHGWREGVERRSGFAFATFDRKEEVARKGCRIRQEIEGRMQERE